MNSEIRFLVFNSMANLRATKLRHFRSCPPSVRTDLQNAVAHFWKFSAVETNAYTAPGARLIVRESESVPSPDHAKDHRQRGFRFEPTRRTHRLQVMEQKVESDRGCS